MAPRATALRSKRSSPFFLSFAALVALALLLATIPYHVTAFPLHKHRHVSARALEETQAEAPTASSSFDLSARGVTIPLKKLQVSRGIHGQMSLQQHLNRARARLITMTVRSPASLVRRDASGLSLEDELAQQRRAGEAALAQRRDDILSGRNLERLTPVGPALPLEQKRSNPRLGHAASTAVTTGERGLLAVSEWLKRRIVGSQPVEVDETQLQQLAAVRGSSSPGAAASQASGADEGNTAGFSNADLQAANNGGLTPSTNPTASGSLGLEIEANDVGYIAPVQMGSSKTQFLMLMDSGSADTWVSGGNCNSCGPHNVLGAKTSTSFQNSNTPFSVTYGTGNVNGTLCRDDMTIAGMTLKAHIFGTTTKESPDFGASDVPFDGLMGLAKSSLSEQRTATPIESLAVNNLVSQPVMGYKLGRVADGSDGEITFGGVDTTKFTGQLVEVDNVSQQGFWEANVDGFSVDGKDVGLKGRTAILDTGTSLIVAPHKDAQTIHAAIPGSKSDGQGGFTVPCTTSAKVALTIGGQAFNIDPRDLAFLPVNTNDLTGDCTSGISAGEIGGAQEWLVGDVFLKSVYFATNVNSNTIGLAPSVQKTTAATGQSGKQATANAAIANGTSVKNFPVEALTTNEGAKSSASPSVRSAVSSLNGLASLLVANLAVAIWLVAA